MLHLLVKHTVFENVAEVSLSKSTFSSWTKVESRNCFIHWARRWHYCQCLQGKHTSRAGELLKDKMYELVSVWLSPADGTERRLCVGFPLSGFSVKYSKLFQSNLKLRKGDTGWMF